VKRPRGAIDERISYYNTLAIHPSARKHGIADDDIGHAVDHAMSIDDRQNDTRLYLGPARNADLLEVATIHYVGRTEVAIHAMKMRSKYKKLLSGE
jgi:GNAT superfamily N-acetyltransferase